MNNIDQNKTYTTSEVMALFSLTKAQVYRLNDKVTYIAGRPNRYWGWSLIEYKKEVEHGTKDH